MSAKHDAKSVHHVMGHVVPIKLLDQLDLDRDALDETIAAIKASLPVTHSGAQAFLAHALEAEMNGQGGFGFGDLLGIGKRVLGTALQVAPMLLGAGGAEAAPKRAGAKRAGAKRAGGLALGGACSCGGEGGLYLGGEGGAFTFNTGAVRHIRR